MRIASIASYNKQQFPDKNSPYPLIGNFKFKGNSNNGR